MEFAQLVCELAEKSGKLKNILQNEAAKNGESGELPIVLFPTVPLCT
jgi:hypothetical protein